MDELSYVYATAAVIVLYFFVAVVRKRFDPFAPVWLFVIGYVQVYVIQALSYHEYAIRARGLEVTTLTNLRAFWAICWFLLIYSLPIGRAVASRAPRAPTTWSSGVLVVMVPILIAWGLAGALLVSYDPTKQGVEVSAEAFILLQFPVMTLIAAILLIITGRNVACPRPWLTAAGLRARCVLRFPLDVQRQAVALADRGAHDHLRDVLLAWPEAELPRSGAHGPRRCLRR